jgi:hypothetical protein
MESAFPYNFNFAVYLVNRKISFFISAVFEVSGAGAKHFCIFCEFLVQIYTIGAC